MRYLVATNSVHTTASACDYLDERLSGGDAVHLVTVPGETARDADDALNVASARLLGRAELTTRTLDSDDPASAILSSIADHDADVVIIGPNGGSPGSGPTLGDTARRIVENANVPVVVVPLSVG